MYRRFLFRILFFALSLFGINAHATHLSGGSMSYRYIGNNQYEVTLRIVRDCLHGSIQTQWEDDPTIIGIYRGDTLYRNDSIRLAFIDTLTVEAHGCDTTVSACYTEAVFKKTYTLPISNTPYNVIMQRCCRNGEVTNIYNVGATGDTYQCTIPANSSGNTSAIFKTVPLQCVCPGTQLVIDNSATDADGDSLSYEYAPVYIGGDAKDAKPFPTHPPFTVVTYNSGFSFDNPMGTSSNTQLDATTGILTAMPDKLGVYVVAIACNEWRNGTKINTATKEYEIMIGIIKEAHDYYFTAGPNPIDNVLNLTLKNPTGTAKIEIWDVRGAVVTERTITAGDIVLNTTWLAKGIYFLQYVDYSRYSVTKILKR